MSIDIESLPSDPEILRPLLQGECACHAERLAQIVDERDAALSGSGRLRAIIEAMQRHCFGRHSERLSADHLPLYRQAQIKPLTNDLMAWLESQSTVTSQKGTLAKAIPLIGSTSYCPLATQAPKGPLSTAYIGKAQPWD